MEILRELGEADLNVEDDEKVDEQLKMKIRLVILKFLFYLVKSDSFSNSINIG